MKEKIWKTFSLRNNTVFIDKLQDLVEEYNKSFHRSIKMTPEEASKKKNEKKVFANLFGNLLLRKHKRKKFNVGDKVRISQFKRKVFDKGFSPNWTEEVFVILKVLETNPVTYELKDLLGEDVKGSFYEKELQKTSQEIFRSKEVLEVDQTKKKAFVKWKGYPKKFNSWIPFSQVKDL